MLQFPGKSFRGAIYGYSGNTLYAYPILVASQDSIVFDPSKNARSVRVLELHSNDSCSSAVVAAVTLVDEFSSGVMLAD